MKLKPLHANVIIKVEKDSSDKQTAGGLFIPATVQSSRVQGVVMAVGSGYALSNGDIRPLTVREGDQVLFNKEHATKVVDDEHYLVTESSILGILD